MKKNLARGLLVLFAGLLFFTGCQTEPSPKLGGWENTEVSADTIQAAARFAVSEQSSISGEPLELVQVRDARAQVVAGMNYSLSLRVRRNGVPADASATIWARLDGSYALTNWRWEHEPER